MNSYPLRSNGLHAQRNGVAIIMVIAFYAVAVAMIGLWVRAALDHQQQVQRWHEKTQANWLAEAGVRRAVARISSDKDYAGERWQIEPAEIGGNYAAEVVIRIESAAENQNSVRIVATAHYPAGEQKRVQSTKTLELGDISAR